MTKADLTKPGVLWPCDIERFYAISTPTRLRWESLGTLPARTVRMGTQSGWLAKDMPDVAAWLATRSTLAESESIPVHSLHGAMQL